MRNQDWFIQGKLPRDGCNCVPGEIRLDHGKVSVTPSSTSPGFSMTEVLMVIAIMLVIAAMAIPTLLTTYRHYQAETTARNVAQVLERTRAQAIKQRTRVSSIFVPASGVNPDMYGIDLTGTGTITTTDPSTETLKGMSFYSNNTPTAVPFPATLPADYQTLQVPPGTGVTSGLPGPPSNYSVTFSPEGTVLVYHNATSTWTIATAIWGLCLTNGSSVGAASSESWLIVVTPAGRIRVFYYSGSGWILS